ncbi:MAG: ExeA family protein [Planctomycetaceae bacterium]
MYEQYWNLDRRPFDNTLHPEFFYAGETHQSARLKVRYAIENRLGAGLLVGGTGSGKSFLAGALAHELADNYRPIVHLVFPQLSPAELLAYIAVELGAEDPLSAGDSGMDRALRSFEHQLRRHSEQGRRPTIFIDDAHLIEDLRVFQTLQLLLNFQQQSRYDFSLILIGERTLAGKLARMAQLDERIGVRAVLEPLSHAETADYVRHRLDVAGAARAIFDETALRAVSELSSGMPRRVNRLCDLALVVGYAENLKVITAAEIIGVAEELPATAAA